MEFVFLIQARLGSNRLPKKVMKSVFRELTLLEVIYKRVLLSKFANRENVYVLTSENIIDNELVEFLEAKKIKYYRGSELNVFNRFYSFLSNYELKPTYFFRICSDNPFLEPLFIDNMCISAINSPIREDYISYIDRDGIPIIQKKYGLFCELIKTSAFLQYKTGKDDYSKENVTAFLYKSDMYKKIYLELPTEIQNFSLCIDTKEDYLKALKVFNKLNKIDFDYLQLINALEKSK